MKVGIIPARSGSKRLPGKNTLLLGGRPLWWLAAAQALHAGLDRAIVTSDDPHIVEAAGTNDGMVGLKRPSELCQDGSPVEDAVRHAISSFPTLGVGDCDSFVVLNPTHPLRRTEDIQYAMNCLDTYPCCVGVRRDYGYTLEEGAMLSTMNQQDRVPRRIVTGSIYACRTSAFLEFGKLLVYGRINRGTFVEEKGPHVDIDTYEDYVAAKALFEHLRKAGN